jgi:hypothetical protein
MSTRREYAASLGLAILGVRGRLSRAANAACDEAEANGTVFDGPVVTVKTAKVKTPKTVKTTRVTSVPDEDDLDEYNLADRNFPEGSTWRSTSGQILNEKQVCSPCGYSLGWHRCALPQAIVSPGVMEYVTLVK